jgi:hypothetical protein
LTEVSLFGLDWIRARLRFNRNGGPYQGRGPDAEKVARLSLKRLFAELRAKRRQGSTVLLVHSPSKSAVRDGYSKFDETVLSAMKRAELPLLEIRPALADHSDLNAIFHDGAHLDPAGHALYGELVARALLPMLENGPLL